MESDSLFCFSVYIFVRKLSPVTDAYWVWFHSSGSSKVVSVNKF